VIGIPLFISGNFLLAHQCLVGHHPWSRENRGTRC
jgi:hypothetical protein